MTFTVVLDHIDGLKEHSISFNNHNFFPNGLTGGLIFLLIFFLLNIKIQREKKKQCQLCLFYVCGRAKCSFKLSYIPLPRIFLSVRCFICREHAYCMSKSIPFYKLYQCKSSQQLDSILLFLGRYKIYYYKYLNTDIHGTTLMVLCHIYMRIIKATSYFVL